MPKVSVVDPDREVSEIRAVSGGITVQKDTDRDPTNYHANK